MSDLETASLSILIASGGRESLTDTIFTATSQMLPGDELIVDYNDDAPWGHAARNRMMPRAKGDALLFIDDDDLYENGALLAVRKAVAKCPHRIHMFRMRYVNGMLLWGDRNVRLGNVSTQMFSVPNVWGGLVIRRRLDEIKRLAAGRPFDREEKGEWDRLTGPKPRWGDRYEGDFDFLTGAVRMFGEPEWHLDVITHYDPENQRAR